MSVAMTALLLWAIITQLVLPLFICFVALLAFILLTIWSYNKLKDYQNG